LIAHVIFLAAFKAKYAIETKELQGKLPTLLFDCVIIYRFF